MQKVLFIQTAFIGDAILATGILEAWHTSFPEDQIHFVVRKGNESLFSDHPFIKKLYVWDKQKGKYKNLIRIWQEVRAEQYDVLFNLQRFGATGLLAGISGAKQIIGFDKNPFSFLFNEKHPHEIGSGTHEVERNHVLLSSFIQSGFHRPKLYPKKSDFERVKEYQSAPYICIAPTSVWFTKQLAEGKWVNFINELADGFQIYLLGAPSDQAACERIINQTSVEKIKNLAGKLSLLQSTALMKKAEMNYTNDSAPMHLASAINAPTTAIFCSTIPNFGFGPLADEYHVVETQESLPCRPCGLHGKKACPKQHFNCAKSIKVEQLAKTLLK